jgi:hypothetical protein
MEINKDIAYCDCGNKIKDSDEHTVCGDCR